MTHLIHTAASDATSAESNFLVPNATFLAELFAFAVLVFILAKYVIPPVNQAMTDRQDKIRAQFDEAAQLKSDAESTESELKAQLADPVGDRVVEGLRVAREVGGGELGRLLRNLSGYLRDEARTRSEMESRQAWTVNGARLAVAAP